jgi:RimJ/RimL family protein N-acetyltransferase
MPVPGPTERLTFREMTPDDLDLLVGLLGDPEVMWVYTHPFSRDEVRAWIEWNARMYREHGFGLWILALRENGAFVGECGLTVQTVAGVTEIEIGYQLLPGAWGRGLATEAAAACRDFARDVAGLERVVAFIDPRNVASQRVAGKIGLAFEREVEIPEKTLWLYAQAFRAPTAAD